MHLLSGIKAGAFTIDPPCKVQDAAYCCPLETGIVDLPREISPVSIIFFKCNKG